jgi:hypothetical protein
MSVAQSFALAAAIVLALSTLADAASRPRYGSESVYGAGAQGAGRAPAAGGSYGGYSSNPQTRALEALADRYRPGW